MKFWDSSAIIPLLIDEPSREKMLDHLAADPIMLAWWATPVECVSAISRRERENSLSVTATTEALERLRVMSESWEEVQPTRQVRTVAQRVLRTHSLRAADALQLAALIAAADGEPTSLPFVCLDERLSQAAQREGFSVLVAE